jgi:hypothetical protein
VVAVLERVTEWFHGELPRLNRLVLFDSAPASLVVDQLADTVLAGLPDPGRLTAREAQQLVVGLGLAGASVARHHQEQDPRRKLVPESSFAGLRAGPTGLPFQQYFGALADRTGTGHYHRDSYASLVLWNVPTTEVHWREQRLAVLPGVFDDGRTRSYTGDGGEKRFFALIKKGETIELAVNILLQPISDGTLAFTDPAAVRAVRLAATLLDALRELFVDFAAAPVSEGIHPEYFLDVFRQFAVHWEVGDIPPSGALDVESLKRDFLLGIDYPGYAARVHLLMPALLGAERAELADLMARPPLPATLLQSVGVAPEKLSTLADADLRALVVRHPVLVDWYLLLTAHARAAGGHLMLSKRFLFNPQRARDAEGAGDHPLVSNRRGTTGMDESFLGQLTHARKGHLLAALRRCGAAALAQPVRHDDAAAADISTVVVGPMEVDDA